MAVVQTDLRNTIDSAKRLRFDSTSINPATNVQDAIGIAASHLPLAKTITAAGPYAALPDDEVLIINQVVAAPFTVTVNWSTRVKPLRVVDGKGDASTNNITVTPAAGQSQLALVNYSYVIANDGGSVTLTPLPNGTGAY